MLNHDSSWYLISTGWWLDGARIDHDIVEPNPPLAYYLTVPAVVLARLADWEPAQALSVYFLAFWFGSVAWYSVIGARCRNLAVPSRMVFAAAACVALLLVAIRDFGQREFLLALFALPYLALTVFQPNNDEVTRTERVLIGVYATLGLALKPYFLLLPAALTLLDMVRKRSLAPVIEPQNVAIAVGCVVYVLATYILHPAYFSDTIPIAMLTYAAFGYDAYAVSLIALPVCLAWLFALYGLSFLSGNDFDIGLRFTVAGLAGLLIYFVQFKGWNYQLVPAAFLTMLACSWIVIGLLSVRRNWVRGCVVALTTAVLLVAMLIWRGPYTNAFPQAFEPFFRSEPGERSFLAMTANVSVSFPMANMTRAEPVSRYPALWIFPGAVSRLAIEDDLSGDQIAQLNDVLDHALRTTVEDFLRGEPELVIVDVRDDKPYFQGVAFDYLSFFRADPQFDELWQRYQLVGSTRGFDIYRLDG